jgi:hypothetical protein
VPDRIVSESDADYSPAQFDADRKAVGRPEMNGDFVNYPGANVTALINEARQFPNLTVQVGGRNEYFDTKIVFSTVPERREDTNPDFFLLVGYWMMFTAAIAVIWGCLWLLDRFRKWMEQGR